MIPSADFAMDLDICDGTPDSLRPRYAAIIDARDRAFMAHPCLKSRSLSKRQ
jgi:hypothetical protein